MTATRFIPSSQNYDPTSESRSVVPPTQAQVPWARAVNQRLSTSVRPTSLAVQAGRQNPTCQLGLNWDARQTSAAVPRLEVNPRPVSLKLPDIAVTRTSHL